MNKLKTTFAGLQLKNPISAGSSNRTNSAQHNLKLEEAGVGAIVLKSLFEENIARQTDKYTDDSMHTEGMDYLQGYLRANELNEYVNLIKESKSLCAVPIIASINCFSSGEWSEFATIIEEAGADAIELNIMSLQTSVEYNDGVHEQTHVDIVRSVREHVKLPIIGKLGANITNPVKLVNRLMANGANGVVLFNRMYQTDINIDTMEYSAGHVLSSEADLSLPLRWVAITSSKVRQIDYALSGGVHSSADVVKSLLAGASAVEVCSALYEQGNEWVAKALGEVEQWQSKNGFASTAEYCGKMSAKDDGNAEKLLRTQFLKYFGGYEK